MKTVFARKAASFISVLSLFATFFVIQQSPVQAAGVNISIALDQSPTVIGRTIALQISISNLSANAVRVTSLTCTPQGTSLRGSTISHLPGVIAANSGFSTSQSYLAVEAGTTNIVCQLTATDMVTGTQFTAASQTAIGEVLAETRLYFTAYASTTLLNVGENVVVTARYGNRGNTPFTNIVISCVELGRALVNISSQQPLQTLPPGWSEFVQGTWQAARSGAGPIACSITATDSTGHQVTIPAPTINIQVR